MRDYIEEFIDSMDKDETIPVEYISNANLIKDIIIIRDEDYEIVPDDFEFEVF